MYSSPLDRPPTTNKITLPAFGSFTPWFSFLRLSDTKGSYPMKGKSDLESSLERDLSIRVSSFVETLSSSNSDRSLS